MELSVDPRSKNPGDLRLLIGGPDVTISFVSWIDTCRIHTVSYIRTSTTSIYLEKSYAYKAINGERGNSCLLKVKGAKNLFFFSFLFFFFFFFFFPFHISFFASPRPMCFCYPPIANL